MNQDAYVLETYSEPSQTSKMEHFSNTRFFYKQHFYNHRQAELAKNQANAKQHPKLLLFKYF